MSSVIMLVAIVGTASLISTFAQTANLPGDSRELVIKYTKADGESHALEKGEFPAVEAPAMMLYSNGLMICSQKPSADAKPGAAENTEPLTYKERKLSKRQVASIVQKVNRLGFEKAASVTPDPNKPLPPRALLNSITVNSKSGAIQALAADNPIAEFRSVASFLDKECSLAKKEYEPEKAVVQTLRVKPKGGKPEKVSSPASETLDADLGISNNESTESFKSTVVEGEKLEKSEQIIEQSDKKEVIIRGNRHKVRVNPILPEYIEPKIVAKEKMSFIPKAEAATQKQLRYLYVIPADMPNNALAGFQLADVANKHAAYYSSKVGPMAPTIKESRVIRGSKTADQYRACPAGHDCKGNDSLAVYYNMYYEFRQSGVSTNVLHPISLQSGCYGWGGYGSGTSYANFDYGFATTPTNMCNWSDGLYMVTTHELGHSFGLSHTCDNTLMGACGLTPTWSQGIALNAAQAQGLREQSPYFKEAISNNPIVAVDVANCKNITGWTLDLDAKNSSNDIHIYIDGVGYNLGPTTTFRPDVNSLYGASGNHGYQFSVPDRFRDGRTHTATIWGINVGPGQNKPVTVTLDACGTPRGSLDGGNCYKITGWAFDMNTTASIPVHIYFNGVLHNAINANAPRSDVNRVYSSYSMTGNYGYDYNIPGHIRDGRTIRVEVFAINAGQGSTNPGLGSYTVTCPPDNPTGNVDVANCTSIQGWALDLSEPTVSNDVHIYISGSGFNTGPTPLIRSDVNNVYAAYGTSGRHGFNFTLPASFKNGRQHTVDVYSIGKGPGDPNRLIGRRTIGPCY